MDTTKKTITLSSIVFALFLTEVTPKVENVEYSDENHKWNCNEICSSAGTEAHFDEETLTCRCVIVTNVDDAEMALIKKNLQLINTHVDPSVDPSNTISRNRRYSEYDPIVGQGNTPPHRPGLMHTPPHKPLVPLHPLQAPHKLPVAPHKLPVAPHKLPVAPHKLPVAPPKLPVAPPKFPLTPPKLPLAPHSRAAQNPAIQEQLERIRKRMQELATARNAQEHLENIRKRLRELRDHAVNGRPTPEQRAARARAYQERMAKERQRIQQLYGVKNAGTGPLFPNRKPGLLGAVAADTKEDSTTTSKPITKKEGKKQKSSSNDDSPESFVNSQHPSSSVVIQPKDLIED